MVATSGYADEAVVRIFETGRPTNCEFFAVRSGQSVGLTAFDPHGRFIAATGADNTVIVWDIESRQLVSTLRAHTAAVNDVTFADDGMIVATGSEDGTARIWHAPPEVGLFDSSSQVGPEIFSGDAATAVMIRGERAFVFETATRKRRKTITTDFELLRAALSPDGEFVLTLGKNSHLHLWDLSRGRDLRTQTVINSAAETRSAGSTRAPLPHDGDALRLQWDLPIRQAQFTPGGQVIASSGSSTRLWKLDGRHVDLPGTVLPQPCFSGDGRCVVLANMDKGDTRVFDAHDGTTVASLRGIARPNFAWFDPERRFLLTESVNDQAVPDFVELHDSSGGAIQVWRLETGNPVRSINAGGQGEASLATQRVVVTKPGLGQTILRLWAIDEGRFLEIPGGTARLSPNGKFVVVLDGKGRGHAVNALDGRVITTLDVGRGTINAHISPTSARLVTHSEDGRESKIWETTTWSEVASFSGVGQCLTTFSPDGRWFLTCSSSGPTRLWPMYPRETAEQVKPRDALTSEERDDLERGTSSE
jgi:WD40 repeat protein